MVEGVESSAENVGQGTAAVNEALAESSASASASAGSEAAGTDSEEGSAGSSATEDLGAGGAGREGLASITELPETGGSSVVMPVSGLLLVALGLALRGAVAR